MAIGVGRLSARRGGGGRAAPGAGAGRVRGELRERPGAFPAPPPAEDMRKKSLRRVRRSTMAQPFALLPGGVARRQSAGVPGVAGGGGGGRAERGCPRARPRLEAEPRNSHARSALEAALRLETARVMGSDALVENALWDDDVAVSAVPRRSEAVFLDENRDGAESNARTDARAETPALRAELLWRRRPC